MIQKRHYLERYEPGPKMPCLCGSGQKFKKCCSGEYQSNAKDGATEAYNAGEYSEALKKCRLHLTWYILCHKAHTIPFLESETKEAEELFEVDIKALAYQVNLLMSCYERTGKHNQFPSALDALFNAITDQRWYDEVAYMRALWQLLDSPDGKLAYHELKKISNLDTTEDANVLALFLQVYPGKLSYSKTIEIIDRIIAAKPRPGMILQYQALKGIQYYLTKDIERAIAIISDAIAEFKRTGLENQSTHDRVILGECLYLLGELSGDRKFFSECQLIYNEVIESNELELSCLAWMHSNLGHLLLAEGRPSEAKVHFTRAYNIEPSEVTKLFIGKSNLNLRRFAEAENVLGDVNCEKFDEGESLDFAIALAILAVETKRQDLLSKAETCLTAVTPADPIFLDFRNSLLEEVKTQNQRVLPKLLRMISRYFLLQPNFFGLGVNVNSILDDTRKNIPQNSTSNQRRQR
jgi:tetratricopeptide (TPR) repeat protein